MLSYQSLEKHDDKDINSMAGGQCISQQKIEKMKLLLKSHQAAIDFDKNVVVQAVTEANFDWNKELLMMTGTDHRQRSTNKNTKRKGYKVNN